MRRPELDYPPLRVFHYSGSALTEGIEVHAINSVPVKIYSTAKTVADCFKFRNKIGVDVAVEALKRYLERADASPRALLQYARICRVERVMQPYLEALV